MAQQFSRLKRGLPAIALIAGLGTGLLIHASPLTAQSNRQLTDPKTGTDKAAIDALAKHLQQIGAKMYGAYWCPHCQQQKELFGSPTFSRYINYIECDPRGQNAKPNLCRAAKIGGYPTWEINGKFYPGTQSLKSLAKWSGYQGSQNF
ncbi:hypothetical protein ACN4EK_30645 [Pantanalinema rosaneae CENA516]|uniref:hypothetical protein n=1 Tax=Pantanalinema rosaneae TaxID=1620701 RepID=UPI003D700033